MLSWPVKFEELTHTNICLDNFYAKKTIFHGLKIHFKNMANIKMFVKAEEIWLNNC